MKKIHIISGLAFIGFILALGCSSGQYLYYTGGGTQCSAGYSPYPAKVVDPSLQPVTQLVPGGTYTYQESDAFFYDKNSDIYIHVRDAADSTGKSVSSSIPCSRNFINYGQLQHKTNFVKTIRDILGVNGTSVTVNTQEIGYVIDTKLNPKVNDPIDQGITSSIQSIYTGQTEQTMDGANTYIYCTAPCDPNATTRTYEIRSQNIQSGSPPFDIVQVRVVFQWTAPTPAAK